MCGYHFEHVPNFFEPKVHCFSPEKHFDMLVDYHVDDFVFRSHSDEMELLFSDLPDDRQYELCYFYMLSLPESDRADIYNEIDPSQLARCVLDLNNSVDDDDKSHYCSALKDIILNAVISHYSDSVQEKLDQTLGKALCFSEEFKNDIPF